MRHRQRQRRILGIGGLPLALAIGLGVLGSSSLAEQWRPKKPILPTLSIDNEGPIAVIRHLRTVPGGHDRQAAPPDDLVLPWRPVIRLDLILPIRTGPWRPPARP